MNLGDIGILLAVAAGAAFLIKKESTAVTIGAAEIPVLLPRSGFFEKECATGSPCDNCLKAGGNWAGTKTRSGRSGAVGYLPACCNFSTGTRYTRNVEKPNWRSRIKDPTKLVGVRVCEATCHPNCAFHYNETNCAGCPRPKGYGGSEGGPEGTGTNSGGFF